MCFGFPKYINQTKTKNKWNLVRQHHFFHNMLIELAFPKEWRKKITVDCICKLWMFYDWTTIWIVLKGNDVETVYNREWIFLLFFSLKKKNERMKIEKDFANWFFFCVYVFKFFTQTRKNICGSRVFFLLLQLLVTILLNKLYWRAKVQLFPKFVVFFF